MEMNKERRMYLLLLIERIKSQVNRYLFNDELRDGYGHTLAYAAGGILWNDAYIKGFRPLLDAAVVENNLEPLDIFYMGWLSGRQFSF